MLNKIVEYSLAILLIVGSGFTIKMVYNGVFDKKHYSDVAIICSISDELTISLEEDISDVYTEGGKLFFTRKGIISEVDENKCLIMRRESGE